MSSWFKTLVFSWLFDIRFGYGYNICIMQDSKKAVQQVEPFEIVRIRVSDDDDAFVEQRVTDLVANERPVHIEINGTLAAVVMALPGGEEELAAGFALSERLVQCRDDFLLLRACDPEAPVGREDSDPNLWPVLVKIVTPVAEQPRRLNSVVIRYACGTVGESLPAALETPIVSNMRLQAGQLREMLRQFSTQQAVFRETGATHAAGLFDAQGNLLSMKEDIGRHNAIDRVLGCVLLNGQDFSNTVLVTTGRASADLVFKALSAKVPVLASISAPTALAVQWARQGGLTLVGFLRPRKLNIYSGWERITAA